MGMIEWLNVLKLVNFINDVRQCVVSLAHSWGFHVCLCDAQDFTVRDAFLSFSWSIMKVSDPVNRAEEASTMTFEDFLEALCRSCDLMSIPTDEDIDALGCKTAGEWDAGVDAETRSTCGPRIVACSLLRNFSTGVCACACVVGSVAASALCRMDGHDCAAAGREACKVPVHLHDALPERKEPHRAGLMADHACPLDVAVVTCVCNVTQTTHKGRGNGGTGGVRRPLRTQLDQTNQKQGNQKQRGQTGAVKSNRIIHTGGRSRQSASALSETGSGTTR